MYRLIVSDGIKTREEFPLEEQITIIGRDEKKCHIFLDSQKVSRQHLRLILKGNKVYIEDLGSSNGVSINEEKVEKIQQISEDDVFHFGEFYAQLNNTNKIKRSYQIDELLARKKREYEKLHEKPYFRLVSEDKRYPGLSFEIENGVSTLGRTKASKIVIPSKSLSKKHLQFTRKGNELIIEDLKSINGTFVNGRKARKATHLKDNDKILIGDLQFSIKTNIEAVVPKKKIKIVPIVLGGAIVLPLLILLPELFKSDPPLKKAAIKPEVTLADKARERALWINRNLGEAERMGKNGQWNEALSKLQKLLAEDPANVQAIKMRSKYYQELELSKVFSSAKQAFDILDFKQCRKLLTTFPEDSYYTQYAKVLKGKATERLIATYYTDARSYNRAKHYQNAYEAVREIFKLTPHHEGALKLKVEIETRTKRWYPRIYKKLNIFEVQDVILKNNLQANSEDKQQKIKKKYPQHETATAILRFVNGEIGYAMKFLQKIGPANKNYSKTRVLLLKLQKFKRDQSLGNQMLLKKKYRDAENHFLDALKTEKELLDGTGLISPYAKQMKQQLSQSFNGLGKTSWKNGRFGVAYKYFKKSEHYDPQNSKNLEDLSRMRKRAQRLWQESLALERQGDNGAFQKWKEVIMITDPKTPLHQNAQKKLAQ